MIKYINENQGFIYLLLTIITIFVSLWSLSRTIKTQKEINKKETNLKYLDKRMEIYNAFSDSAETLLTNDIETWVLLGVYQKSLEHIENMLKTRVSLFSKYNQAVFYFKGDHAIIDYLKEIRDDYLTICNHYIETQTTFNSTIGQAWSIVLQRFPDMQFGNIQMLYANPEAKQLYLLHCVTPSTKLLDELIQKYIQKFDYDKFDVRFEKYFC